MNAAITLHFRSEEQIQELQHVLADRPWWRVTIFHSSSTTTFVCDGCRHLALPHNGKLLSMKWKFEYWSSPWQIWVLAQIIHYRFIPWICQGTVQYSCSYQFRQICCLLSPNFLCIAATNSTGQQVENCREEDTILDKMSIVAEGSEPLLDCRWAVFRALLGEEFISWYSTRLNFDQG